MSSTLTVFLGTPSLTEPAPLVGKGRPRTRRLLAAGVESLAVSALAAAQPAKAWRLLTWRNGTNRPGVPAAGPIASPPPRLARAPRRVAPEVWLLCERDLETTPRTKYHLVHLPATASLKALVRLAHQRWAIEQQYQELKDELGLDSLEGRSLPTDLTK